jgi:hypothetical protein
VVIVPGVLSGGAPDEPLPVIGPSYLAVVQRSGVGLYVHLAGLCRYHAAPMVIVPGLLCGVARMIHCRWF